MYTFYNGQFLSVYNKCQYDKISHQLVGDLLPNDEENVCWFFNDTCGCFAGRMKYGEIDKFMDVMPAGSEKTICGWLPLSFFKDDQTPKPKVPPCPNVNVLNLFSQI